MKLDKIFLLKFFANQHFLIEIMLLFVHFWLTLLAFFMKKNKEYNHLKTNLKFDLL